MSTDTSGDEIRAFFLELANNRALYNDYLVHPLKAMRGEALSEDAIGLILQGDLSELNRRVQAVSDSEQGEGAAAAASAVVICGTIVRT